MTDELTAQLRRDEGEVLHVYQDSLGYLTLGVGRLVDEKMGGGITKDESAYLLANDIVRVGQELQQNFHWSANLSDARRGVMMNMLFNLGLPKFLSFKRFLAALERGDISTAAAEMMASDWSKQVGARAGRLRQQLLENRWI